jgi:polyhydroxyalkanoate synthesis regulator phasin
MNKQRLDEIRRRQLCAGIGPWRAEHGNIWTAHGQWRNISNQPLAHAMDENDAELMAHAREDIRELVEHVDYLEARIKYLNNRIAKMQKQAKEQVQA